MQTRNNNPKSLKQLLLIRLHVAALLIHTMKLQKLPPETGCPENSKKVSAKS